MSDLMVISLVDVTNQYDNVFWFGDFNCHLREHRDVVEAILKDHTGDNMNILLQHDELSKAMNEGQSLKLLLFCQILRLHTASIL